MSGAVAGQQQAKQVASFTGMITKFLLVFAAIALFVGAFLIFNTFTILVGQRTRELALLRAVGASRGQVTRSVLAEALTVGLLGSMLGIGAALAFLGVAMLAPFVTGRLARVLGAPLPAIEGVAGRLGPENAARNPRRTAATVSALMIGLAVVSAIATVGASAISSFNNAFTKGMKGDYVVVATSGFEGFQPVIESSARRAPGVLAASPIRMGRGYDGRAGKDLEAIDPVDGPKVINIPIISAAA